MSHMTRYRMLRLAQANADWIREHCHEFPDFGDLHDQVSRSSQSVQYRMSEGLGSRSPRNKLRYLDMARCSNDEFAKQAPQLLQDPTHPLLDHIDHVGRMLTNYMKRLE